MNSPAHDIALWLATQLGHTVYTAAEPPSPDNTVTIYDTGGDGPDTDQLDIMQPEFQVRVRDISFPAAYNKHIAIKDLLLYDTQIVMETSVFSQVDMAMEIMSLGRDESNRFILVATYRGRRTEQEIT